MSHARRRRADLLWRRYIARYPQSYPPGQVPWGYVRHLTKDEPHWPQWPTLRAWRRTASWSAYLRVSWRPPPADVWWTSPDSYRWTPTDVAPADDPDDYPQECTCLRCFDRAVLGGA